MADTSKKNLILLESYMKLKIQEAKANLKEGEELDYDVLKEGLLDGIKSMFKSDSTIGNAIGGVKQAGSNAIQGARDAATAAATKVKDTAGAAVDKTKQVAGAVKSDFQTGSNAGDIKKVMSAMAKLDQKFGAQKQEIAQRFSQVNKERAAFMNQYREAKAQLQGKVQQSYDNLAKTLKIDTTQAGWQDKIDTVLKQKKLAE